MASQLAVFRPVLFVEVLSVSTTRAIDNGGGVGSTCVSSDLIRNILSMENGAQVITSLSSDEHVKFNRSSVTEDYGEPSTDKAQTRVSRIFTQINLWNSWRQPPQLKWNSS